MNSFRVSRARRLGTPSQTAGAACKGTLHYQGECLPFPVGEQLKYSPRESKMVGTA